MRNWLRRLVYLFRQSRHDAELREEIEAHRALRAAHLERDGLTPQQAADASRRAIGNVLLAREDVREVWLGSWATWWQDVRYGLRTLRKNPMFTAVAVVTIALGIGVNAGIFTVLNGVLFRDLPAPDAHELVSIYQTVEGVQDSRRHRSRHLLDFRVPRLSRSGADALRSAGPRQSQGDDARRRYAAGDPRRDRQLQLLRRAAAASSARPSADRAGLRARRGSRRRPQSRPVDDDVCRRPRDRGTHHRAQSASFTVVGVAAEGTYGGSASHRWPDISRRSARSRFCGEQSRYENDKHRWLYLIGRRKRRAGLEQVRAELGVIAAQIDQQQPGRSTTLTVERANPMTVRPKSAAQRSAARLF